MAKNVSIFDGTAWVSIVGPPGVDGKDGKDGSGVDIKGTATVYPPDAAPTVGDMWIVADPVPAGFPAGTNAGDGLVWTGTEWNNVGGIRGPAGKDGKDGADGAPGQDGADGAAGADGAGFTFKGEWDAGGAYVPNDVVTFNGTTFIYVAGSGDEETSDLIAWNVLCQKGDAGADGAAGADGLSFTYRGDYDADAEYEVGDVIYYPPLKQTLILVSATGKAKRPAPDDRATIWDGVWNTMTVDGRDGADGAKGDTGDDGRSVAVTKSPTQPATAAIGDFWIQE
jgi:hypothetical protein